MPLTPPTARPVRLRALCQWGALALALLLALPSRPALAEEIADPRSIDGIEGRLQHTRQRLAELRERYLADARMASKFPLENRLQEGLVLLEVQDPERASIVFLDIVGHDEWKGQAGYQHAMFLLAKALYLAGHKATAAGRLREVLKTGRAEDYDDALQLLIELGAEHGDLTDTDEIFASLDRTGTVPSPQLLYARGKGLYLVGRYADAVASFARLDPATLAGLKAMYFRGVTYTRLEQLDQALADFAQVIQLGATIPDAAEIVEYAQMAKARIYYERGEWTDALDTYQNIGRNSRLFDRALYEITWTHIRKEEVPLALRNLEILILSRPDSLFVPDARRLQADLLKESGEYERALDTYETILVTYEPILNELRAQVSSKGGDPLAFFQELVAADEVGRGQYIPRAAAELVEPDALMREATLLVGGLAHSLDNISESRQILEEISAAMDSESRYEFFPEMRGAWLALLETDSTLMAVGRDLNELQISGSAGGSVSAARRTTQDEFAALPQTKESYVEREQALQAALDERRLRAFSLRSDIEGADAKIDAMRRWVLLEGTRAGLSPEEEQSLRDDLSDAQLAVRALKEELVELEHQIRVLSSLGTGNQEMAARESDLRSRYRLAIKQERDALKSGRGGGDYGRVDRAWTELEALEGDLATFRAEIVAAVDARVGEVKSVLKAEQALIERYSVDYDSLQGDVQLVGGEIAYRHWTRVEALFADLVLAADVGVVDVAWLKKEENTRHLEALMDERNQEREILQQDFEEMLKELGVEGREP